MQILTENNFIETIYTLSKPSIIQFSANWCDLCKIFDPVLKSIIEEYNTKINFFKVDVENSPALADKFHIQRLPTFILFNDRKITNCIVGTTTSTKFKDMLNESLIKK